MRSGLRYADAVRLLGGSSPLVTLTDNLLGGALSAATAGGADLALSLFDAKTEAIRLGHLVTTGLTERVRGLSRYDRGQRLHAAHAILVVTAYFQALDEHLGAAGLGSPGFTRDDQLRLAGADRADGDWPARLLSAEIPGPAPDRDPDLLSGLLREHYAVLAIRTHSHLAGLAVWEAADETARARTEQFLIDSLPDRALERYQESVRRLAGEVPEFD